MNIQMYHFKSIVDERGELVALEENNEIPFSVKRVYYMYNMPENSVRGLHAHKQLKQVLVCISGRCKILLDNGEDRKVVELDHPTKGLFIDSMIWRKMYDFSTDCVLVILASEMYDEADYIRDYDQFLKMAINGIA